MIDDSYILNKFWPNKISILQRKLNANLVSIEEKEYLMNRYSDTLSLAESLYRIKANIEEVPLCPTCHNKLKYDDKKKRYRYYCGKECAGKDPKHIEARKKGIFDKYGCYCTMQLKEVKEKSKESWANKTTNEIKEIKEKSKKTCIKKYGIDNWCGQKKNKEHWANKSKEELNEITEKKKKTFLKHYGVDNYTKTNEWRKHVSDISDSIKRKAYATMKRKKSFLGNTSKEEKKVLELLGVIYPDIIHQYRDNERYPWNCDFYIPSKDLFIEYQGFYTHNNHAYNKESTEDQIEKEKLIKKYGEDSQSVTIWTIKDVEKRETAKKNNLNYIEFFNLKEVEKYIENPIF